MTAVTRAVVEPAAIWDVATGIATFLIVICGGGLATRLVCRGGS